MNDSTKTNKRSAPALSDSAKAAMGWAHTARFLTTASQLHQLPEMELPEIAFVGRSNAGKSTAINTLTQQKRLAFASKTPGRTQHINLFTLGPKDQPDAIFADLPGYGYAAVTRSAKYRWQAVMADYLRQRPQLAGVVLMVDPRLGLTELDLQLLDFVAERVHMGEVRLLVVLTKSDKLNRRDQDAALAGVQDQLAAYSTQDADISVALFSALSKKGVEDVAELIRSWIDDPLPGFGAAQAGGDDASEGDEPATADGAVAGAEDGEQPS